MPTPTKIVYSRAFHGDLQISDSEGGHAPPGLYVRDGDNGQVEIAQEIADAIDPRWEHHDGGGGMLEGYTATISVVVVRKRDD